ncbi:MAG TPA: hypothetical protein DCF33_21140, partial [Saprospirales bacterium]|nr:hypothetical protein [Saprospirales bacterium]
MIFLNLFLKITFRIPAMDVKFMLKYLWFLWPFIAGAQTHDDTTGNLLINQPATPKMTIEIWSDIVCPFCYIGKRKLEQALAQTPQKDQVKIVWKSFQLDPVAPSNGGDYLKNLSERKGWDMAQTRQIAQQVTDMAAGVGLEYHFEKAVSANSFDAHRLAHLAAKYGLQNEAEEALFKAHFSEGKNIADFQTLLEIGSAIGLDSNELK